MYTFLLYLGIIMVLTAWHFNRFIIIHFDIIYNWLIRFYKSYQRDGLTVDKYLNIYLIFNWYVNLRRGFRLHIALFFLLFALSNNYFCTIREMWCVAMVSLIQRHLSIDNWQDGSKSDNQLTYRMLPNTYGETAINERTCRE